MCSFCIQGRKLWHVLTDVLCLFYLFLFKCTTISFRCCFQTVLWFFKSVIVLHSVSLSRLLFMNVLRNRGKGDDKEDVAGLKVYLQHVNCIWNSRNEIKCSKDRTHGLFTKASSETASVEGWLSGRWRKGWGVSHYTRTDWKSVSAGLMSQIWSISQKLKSANEDVIGWFLPHVVKKWLCLTCGPFPLAAIFPYVPFTCSPSGFADVLCFAFPFLRLVFVFAETACLVRPPRSPV